MYLDWGSKSCRTWRPKLLVRSHEEGNGGRSVDVLWCVGLAACIMFVAYTLKA
jgi:hypothetical protein